MRIYDVPLCMGNGIIKMFSTSVENIPYRRLYLSVNQQRFGLFHTFAKVFKVLY